MTRRYFHTIKHALRDFLNLNSYETAAVDAESVLNVIQNYECLNTFFFSINSRQQDVVINALSHAEEFCPDSEFAIDANMALSAILDIDEASRAGG